MVIYMMHNTFLNIILGSLKALGLCFKSPLNEPSFALDSAQHFDIWAKGSFYFEAKYYLLHWKIKFLGHYLEFRGDASIPSLLLSLEVANPVPNLVSSDDFVNQQNKSARVAFELRTFKNLSNSA